MAKSINFNGGRKRPVVMCNVETLQPRTSNPRTHSDRHISQIARSIEQFGFTNPILTDEAGGIVAGHGRVAAAKKLGIKDVPTICLSDLTETEIRAYVIADNRLAELAGWDDELLAIELQDLSELELDFDLEIIGFDAAEIDVRIASLEDEAEEEATPPEPEPGPAITQPGDIWIIGRHRLICGDSLDPAIYERLLGDELAQMVFTDPPYNVPIDGHVCGAGKVRHREFAMASGEMTPEEFTRFLGTVFENLANASADGSIHFICMDWRHMGEVLNAGSPVYSRLQNLCVWTKTNGGMGSLYRSQHELVFVYKSGEGRHINNVELGRHGRNRTNVWPYAGINSFGANRDEDLAAHPTVKPVQLVADAILDCSSRGAIVLDAFAGSGSTLLAAEKTGRRGYGIELDLHYCDVIVRRLVAATGGKAVHAETGRAFDEVAADMMEADHV